MSSVNGAKVEHIEILGKASSLKFLARLANCESHTLCPAKHGEPVNEAAGLYVPSHLMCTLRHAVITVRLSQLVMTTVEDTAPSTSTHREHFSTVTHLKQDGWTAGS